MVTLQVLAFNDFHGNLEPPAGSGGRIPRGDGSQVDVGGAAHLARLVGRLRGEHAHTLVVSAGDLVGASPLVSGLFHDEPAVEVMNLLGLDFNAVGNHEFDEGPEELLRLQNGGCHPLDGCLDADAFSGARFAFLAANVRRAGAGGSTLFPAYAVRELGGVRVGIMGLTLEGTPELVSASSRVGLTFADEVDTINALVPELRARGAQVILVLLHEGGQPTGFYDECPGISGPVVDIALRTDPAVNVILSGHTHQAYNCTLGGKLVTSAASYGRLLTQVLLSVRVSDGAVLNVDAHNIPVERTGEDPGVAGLVAFYRDLSLPLAQRPVGLVTATLESNAPRGTVSALGMVIADAQRDSTAAPEDGGSRVALMNPGGVRAPLQHAASPGESTDGLVTYGELFSVQPFGNTLVVLPLTGAQIHALLEQQFQQDGAGLPVNRVLAVSSGFTYAYSLGAPRGNKVDPHSILLDGRPLDPAGAYRVTVNGFLASGGDGFSVLAQATPDHVASVDLDALAEWMLRNSPVSAPAADRVRVLP